MSLLCASECDDYRDPGAIYYYFPDDTMSMPELKRRKRCLSCGELLSNGQAVYIFKRYKYAPPKDDEDWEDDAENYEVPLAPEYMCEQCGDLACTLDALGYVIQLKRHGVQDAMSEYWDMTGFKPEKRPTKKEILDLVVKAHWYELIKSGQKKCEYREIKKYWMQKLAAKKYTHVRFRKGYTREHMLFEIMDIGQTTEQNDLNLPCVYKIQLAARIE